MSDLIERIDRILINDECLLGEARNELEAKDRRIAELESLREGDRYALEMLAEDNERLTKIIQGKPASLGLIDENQRLWAKLQGRDTKIETLRAALAAAKENDGGV